jgi:hypothetical protein
MRLTRADREFPVGSRVTVHNIQTSEGHEVEGLKDLPVLHSATLAGAKVGATVTHSVARPGPLPSKHHNQYRREAAVLTRCEHHNCMRW